MDIAVIGAGEVGFHLADILSREEHRVSVIDADPAKARRIMESLDVQVVAHYVQNRNVLQVMHDLGVDYVQGFAVCAPRPLSDWLHPDNAARPAPRRLLAPLSLVRGGREH